MGATLRVCLLDELRGDARPTNPADCKGVGWLHNGIRGLEGRDGRDTASLLAG